MGRAVAGEAPTLDAAATAGRVGSRGGVAHADRPEGAPASSPRATTAVHRLRDLDRRQRWWALALAAAVVLTPLAALVHYLPDWAPNGDPALMAIRSLDVGTSRTPLLGQPSTASEYAGADGHVHHPGPLHFYLLAGPVRLFGGAVGMPLVSVAITSTCLLVSLWAAFRQLGRAAAAVAAIVLATTAFTTGASSLVNPVSSSIAGYPLLATAALAWCLVCGDVRLLPLVTAFASFTAQQHLSVDPAVAVLTAGTLGLAARRWRRGRSRADLRSADAADLGRSAGWSALVALVMWAPVLLQQAFGNAGNLGQMLTFARHGNRETLGYGRATWQVAHAVGLPPLLGRTDLSGTWLTSRPSVATWASAGLVLGAVAVVSWRRRVRDPRVAALGATVGVTCVAGLVSGSSVPVGLEQERLTFYHWAVVASFLTVLTLAVAALRDAGALLARLPEGPRHRAGRLRHAAVPAAVVLTALPAFSGIVLERHTDSLVAAYSPLASGAVDAAADRVAAHRAELGDHVVIVSSGEPVFSGIREAVAFALIERGIDVRLPLTSRFFVHDQRLVDRDRVDGAVMVIVDRAVPTTAPEGGELVAEVDLDEANRLDVDAWDALVRQIRSGPAPSEEVLAAALADRPDGEAEFWASALGDLPRRPETLLARRAVLTFLLDHPDVAPAIDPALVTRVRDTLPPEEELDRPGHITRLRIYLLDADEAQRLAILGPVPW